MKKYAKSQPPRLAPTAASASDDCVKSGLAGRVPVIKRAPAPQAPWATKRALRLLRKMWAAGDSVVKIGKAIGVSKNSIVNMRRTLKLAGRPSPIAGGPRGAHPPTGPRPRRDPSPDQIAAGLAALDAPIKPTRPRPIAAAPRRPVPTPPRRPAIPPPGGRVVQCCWVTAESTGGRLPVYCDGDSMHGLSYCPEHAEQAYPALRRRLQAAARGGPAA